MILQALTDYYDRKARDPDPMQRLPAFGLEEKEIPFIIELDADGSLVQMRDTRTLDGKKMRAQAFLVPKSVKRASGIAANLLWDTAEYALGIDSRDKSERVAEQHAAFRVRLNELAEVVSDDPGLQAVLAFLDKLDVPTLADVPCWNDIAASNPLITFQLLGDIDLVCQRPAIVAAAVNGQDEENSSRALCLVKGVEAPVERLHAAIKGVWGAQTAGANIVSFNAPAFESYGKRKRQGDNAPVGKPAAFAYTTALNHLLARDSRNRVQVGDASTVFWADRPSSFDSDFTLADFFGEPPKDNPDRNRDAVRALLEAAQAGKLGSLEGDARFFVLGLAPNAARISIRFWHTSTLRELAPRVLRHFEDMRVVRRYSSDPEIPSIFRLLTSVALQGKADNIPPRLAGELIRAILDDLPYPATLLNAAVARCRAEREVTYLRACVLKAWLNRDIRRIRFHSSQKEFLPMLDPDNQNPAYRLGRLFAVLERIQEYAAGGPGKLNATIRDRYYGAASSTPVAVFTTLLRLKNAHLKKLAVGQSVFFERVIGEIMSGLMDFPRQLTLSDQGRFALGYYHQRQDFYTKKPDVAPADNQLTEGN